MTLPLTMSTAIALSPYPHQGYQRLTLRALLELPLELNIFGEERFLGRDELAKNVHLVSLRSYDEI